MLKLKDLLPFISYDAQLQVMETERNYKRYNYIFSKDLLIRRDTIEKYYPELLERELSDGVHGEGNREGMYIHLFK